MVITLNFREKKIYIFFALKNADQERISCFLKPSSFLSTLCMGKIDVCSLPETNTV